MTPTCIIFNVAYTYPNLKVAYITNGQNVPEDITVIDSLILAKKFSKGLNKMDQASSLRKLIFQNQQNNGASTKIITVSSGKGGVGKALLL